MALFYGHDSRFTCSKCVGVMRHAGSRWQLLKRLHESPVWPQIRRHYTHVMIPHEIDVMSTHGAGVRQRGWREGGRGGLYKVYVRDLGASHGLVWHARLP